MLTTLFSTHGFQHFSFPFTQRNAISKSDQQYTESMETCPFKATNTSFRTLINKTHLNNSKRGMDNFFNGATLVLAHKKLTLIPKVVSTRMETIPGQTLKELSQKTFNEIDNIISLGCSNANDLTLNISICFKSAKKSFQTNSISLDIFSSHEHRFLHSN